MTPLQTPLHDRLHARGRRWQRWLADVQDYASLPQPL